MIVTLGGRARWSVEPGGVVEHLPPRPTTVCDTTGAGDTFNGVLAAQLAAGAGLLDAARAANVGGRAVGAPRRGACRDADRGRDHCIDVSCVEL